MRSFTFTKLVASLALQWATLRLPTASAAPPSPGSLWQVSPPLDYNDTLYAGWDQISVEKEIQIYNGVAQNRTYAHHPELFAVGTNVFLIYSSAPVDEDSMGQDSELYADTVYGTEYGMKKCARACEINNILKKPDEAPAWSPWLYNNGLFAADGTHQMEEQTFAVWHNDSDSPTGGYWQRHWRDISPEKDNTHSVWIEYNEDPNGDGWYPKVKEPLGNEIYQTNIPDAKTKQFLGKLDQTGDRYLLSNPRYNAADPQRQPLTLAVSRGKDQTYTAVGVLRTNATKDIVPDTRDGIKNRAHGFSYPTAVQVGDKLVVAYSENKENIWVSIVDIAALPEGAKARS
ncbi:hypothetical protein EsH8_VIII_001024 [Colletotrichum jinshuiense]